VEGVEKLEGHFESATVTARLIRVVVVFFLAVMMHSDFREKSRWGFIYGGRQSKMV
jgi:hypothetical protein